MNRTARLTLAGLLALGMTAIAAAQADPPKLGSKIWIGRYAELEEFIRTAPIVRTTEVPIGVTKPRRGYFEPGGPVGSVVLKNLIPSRSTGFLESYESEIAAYEIDKLLELNMVPPTVQRKVGGTMGSAQLWVDNAVSVVSLKGQPAPNPEEWNRQIRRWRVFHNLIADIDPNEGNELVVRDPNWQLVLVDHSRAFTNTTKMVFEMKLIDRPFYERVKSLDKATLDAKIGKLVLDGSKSILKRRDLIVAHFDKLAAAQGEAKVFVD
jgi:hypothetical protein